MVPGSSPITLFSSVILRNQFVFLFISIFCSFQPEFFTFPDRCRTDCTFESFLLHLYLLSKHASVFAICKRKGSRNKFCLHHKDLSPQHPVSIFRGRKVILSATYVSEENMIEVIVDLLLKLGTGSRDSGPGWEGRNYKDYRRQLH